MGRYLSVHKDPFQVLYFYLGMFIGLKKIVGKNAISEDNNSGDNQRIPEHCDSMHASNMKSTKKRKVDYLDPASAKKKYVLIMFVYIR